MGYWEALWLGLLQGLTEFLPVSSSGHMVLLAALFGFDQSATEQLHLSILLHIATAMSTIVVFRQRIWQLLRRLPDAHGHAERVFVGGLLLSALPIAAAGFLFRTHIEELFAGHPAAVGASLLLTSLFLLIGHRCSRAQRTARPLVWWMAVVIGFVQVLALLPGISRSGSTISAALCVRMGKEEAVEFAFLMALIPILGGACLELVWRWDTFSTSVAASPDWLPMLLAAGVAFW